MADVTGAALVVGGASGIGARLRRGARRRRLAGRRRRPEARPGRRRASPLDVRDREAVAAVVAQLAERDGPLGAVVYAAGTARVTPILEIEPREWDLVLGVNLTGAFNVLQAAAPHIADGRLLHRDLLDRLRLAGPRPRPLLRHQGRGRGAGPLGRARARPARHPLQRGPAGRWCARR